MGHGFGCKRWAAAVLVLGVLLATAAVSSGSFGRDGKTVLPQVDRLREILPYGSSRTLLVSSDYETTGEITRVLADGRVDRSFGNAGQVKIPLIAAAVQPDGKILVLDNVRTESGGHPVLRRLLPNGDRDRGFGGDGSVRVELGGRYDSGTALLTLPDGRIAVAGDSGDSIDQRLGVITHPVVARLKQGGAADRSFGDKGHVITGEWENITDLEAGPNGSLFALSWVVVKLRRDGSRDPSFDEDGIAAVHYGREEPYFLPSQGLDVYPNGGVLISGTSSRGKNSRAGVLRLRPDGSPDPRFGANGIVRVGVRGWTFGQDAVARANGKALVVASSQSPPRSNSRLTAISLRRDGLLDQRFGRSGKVTIEYRKWVNGVDLAIRGRAALLAGEILYGGSLLAKVPLERSAGGR